MRPFPPHVVPRHGSWRGADSLAPFGSRVWRDNVHFGRQNIVSDSALLGSLRSSNKWSAMDHHFLTCLETALCRGAQSRAKFGPVVWRDNLHFKMRNTNIASPLLGPMRGPKQWSVMDHCFLSRFETILANYRPQKWLIVRPFPPRMVPHLGPWRGAVIVAQFGPCVWRDTVHFGPQKIVFFAHRQRQRGPLSALFFFIWSHIVGCANGRIVEHALVWVCAQTTSILDPKTLSMTQHCLGHCDAPRNGPPWTIAF